MHGVPVFFSRLWGSRMSNGQSVGLPDALTSKPARVTFAILGPIAVVLIFYTSFLFMRDADTHRAVVALIALVVGVGGIWALFASLTNAAEALPTNARYAMRPWVFVGPALAVLMLYIVFPSIRTVWISFFDRTSTQFVGLRNYVNHSDIRRAEQAQRRKIQMMLGADSLGHIDLCSTIRVHPDNFIPGQRTEWSCSLSSIRERRNSPSRIISSSYSFHPRMDSSSKTSEVGEACRPAPAMRQTNPE